MVFIWQDVSRLSDNYVFKNKMSFLYYEQI